MLVLWCPCAGGACVDSSLDRGCCLWEKSRNHTVQLTGPKGREPAHFGVQQQQNPGPSKVPRFRGQDPAERNCLSVEFYSSQKSRLLAHHFVRERELWSGLIWWTGQPHAMEHTPGRLSRRSQVLLVAACPPSHQQSAGARQRGASLGCCACASPGGTQHACAATPFLGQAGSAPRRASPAAQPPR